VVVAVLEAQEVRQAAVVSAAVLVVADFLVEVLVEIGRLKLFFKTLKFVLQLYLSTTNLKKAETQNKIYYSEP
jgi:hypothetical protein